MKLGYSMRLAMRHKHHHSFASSRAHTHLGETSNRADALPCIARMRWIKSPAWDLVWVLNTVWLAPLVFLLGLGHDDVHASPVDWLFFVLAVPLWFGHRVSSAWLAYATPAYRPLLATQRLRFVVAPLAIAVACFAVLLAPESVLPMPLTERVVCLAVLDYLLVSHHFATQHFGLLSLYSARAGRSSDANARRLDRWFALVVGGGFVVLANALAGSIAFQDRWIDPLLGEALSDTVAADAARCGMVVVVTITALVCALRRSPPSPPVAYVVGVSAIVLFPLIYPSALPAGPSNWRRTGSGCSRSTGAAGQFCCCVTCWVVEAVTENRHRISAKGSARVCVPHPSFRRCWHCFATACIHYVLDRAPSASPHPDVGRPPAACCEKLNRRALDGQRHGQTAIGFRRSRAIDMPRDVHYGDDRTSAETWACRAGGADTRPTE